MLWGRLVMAFGTAFVLGCSSSSSDMEYVQLVEGEARTTGGLKDGRRHGRWVTVENGRITQIEHWRDGLEHGPRRVWYLDGMYTDERRLDGKLHGRSRFFYNNGQIAELAWYENNERVGLWCSWNPDGSLDYIIDFTGRKIVRDRDPPGECPLVLDQPRHLDVDDQDYSLF